MSELDDSSDSDFGPPMIPETSEDLRASVDRRLGPAAQEQPTGAPPPDPRDKPSWFMDFAWVDSRGEPWVGRFRSEIRSTAKRLKAAAMFAQLTGGFPVESLRPLDRLLAGAIAYLETALDPKERPEWAKNLLAIPDPWRVVALWKEAVTHETVYFRASADQMEGAAAGQAGGPPGVVGKEVRPPGDRSPLPGREPG